MTGPRRGHGWWPYVVPYCTFLLLHEIGRRLPSGADPWMLVIQPGITLALVVAFARGGAYPEWGDDRSRVTVGGIVSDVLVGLGLAAVWVVPYLLIPSIRPGADVAFDPAMAGEAWTGVIVLLRLAGFAVVTPIFEELFIRSFVLRLATIDRGHHDFRDLPLARYTSRSLVITTVLFTVAHAPWEWWVAPVWFVLSTLWFYRRKSLTSIMVLHGATNAAILAAAWFGGLGLHDPNGAPLSLWFFV